MLFLFRDPYLLTFVIVTLGIVFLVMTGIINSVFQFFGPMGVLTVSAAALIAVGVYVSWIVAAIAAFIVAGLVKSAIRPRW